jgi:hypothetical protein
MVIDEYTLLSWAQNPYYDNLTSLEPLRKALKAQQGCCGQGAFSRSAFAETGDHPKLYDDMQFMRNVLGTDVLSVRVATVRMQVAA